MTSGGGGLNTADGGDVIEISVNHAKEASNQSLSTITPPLLHSKEDKFTKSLSAPLLRSTFSADTMSDNVSTYDEAIISPLSNSSTASYIESNGIVPIASHLHSFEILPRTAISHRPSNVAMSSKQYNYAVTTPSETDEEEEKVEGSMGSTSNRNERSRSFRSHSSHTNSHDTNHTSTTRSVSPSETQYANSMNSNPSGSTPLPNRIVEGRQATSAQTHSSLARSSSDASTTPTSPETELNASMHAVEGFNFKSTTASASDSEGFIPADSEDQPLSLHVFSNESSTESSDLGIVSPSTTLKVYKDDTPEIQSISLNETVDSYEEMNSPSTSIRYSRTSFRSSNDTTRESRPIASLAHRNKPLPIPAELASTQAVKQRKDENLSDLAVPAFSISTSEENGDGDVQPQGQRSHNGSATNLHTIDEENSSQLNSFQSFLNKSGRLFRSSTYSRDSTLSPWTPNHSPDARLSDTSLPYAQSRLASPNGSNTNIAAMSFSGSRNPSQTNLNGEGVQESYSSPSLFGLFAGGRSSGRREKSAESNRLSSSSIPQSYHRSPLPSPSISSTSDSSNGPHQGSATQCNSNTHRILKRTNRLSHQFNSLTLGNLTHSSTTTNTATSNSLNAEKTSKRIGESDTVTAAIVEASKKLQRRRPGLHRTGSRSVDDISSRIHPEALKSLAVGTVSIFDEKQTLDSSPSSSANNAVDSVDAKDAPEKTWSRLAGSLRKKRSSRIPVLASDTKLNLKTSEPSLHESQLPPKPPPKDMLKISTDAWWESTSKLEKSQTVLNVPDDQSNLMHFEAVRLATAISQGDQDLVARMESAIESPKAIMKPLDLTDPKRMEEIEQPSEDFGKDVEKQNALKSETESFTNASVLDKDQDEIEKPQKYRSKSSMSNHKRSMSLSKVLEPFVSVSQIRDIGLPSFLEKTQDSATENHSSRSPTLRHVKRSSTTLSPPSSYRGDRWKGLTKSESDTSLFSLQIDSDKFKTTYSSFDFNKDKSTQTSSPTNLPPRISSMGSSHRRKMSLPTPSLYPSPDQEITKKSESRKSKPSLSVDIDAATFVGKNSIPVRPSSAMAMSMGIECGSNQRSSFNAKQPTLSIADDVEFLQALEQVRKVNQERIKKQREQNEKVQQEDSRVKQEIMIGQIKKEIPTSSLNGSFESNSMPKSFTSARQRSASASGRLAEGRMRGDENGYNSYSNEEMYTGQYSPGRSNARPSPLELGVGKASGKLRDGAFMNDEDWKKEVKALFVIREIVLTERSYASHLEALLNAIRQMDLFSTTPVRRSTTTSLMMSSSSQVGPIPQHINIMRNILPQLITLSRTLANRIDENPTAAGVGAAFRLVGNQMESTFVAWNSVVKDLMDALRISEGSKGKNRNRIGLISIVPPQHLVQGHAVINNGTSKNATGFKSVPASPIRALTFLEKQAGIPTSADESTFVESPVEISFLQEDEIALEDSKHSTQTISKRRSTISSITPSMAANLRSKFSTPSSNVGNDKNEEFLQSQAHLEQSNSNSAVKNRSFSSVQTPSSVTNTAPMSAKRRMSSVVKNGLLFSSLSSIENGQEPISAPNSIPTLSSPLSSSPSTTLTSTTSKKLTPMDIVIMPTQRIPRYLLLLRDLHANTPPQSLSNARLQRSLDFVQRVAMDCDRVSKGGRIPFQNSTLNGKRF